MPWLFWLLVFDVASFFVSFIKLILVSVVCCNSTTILESAQFLHYLGLNPWYQIHKTDIVHKNSTCISTNLQPLAWNNIRIINCLRENALDKMQLCVYLQVHRVRTRHCMYLRLLWHILLERTLVSLFQTGKYRLEIVIHFYLFPLTAWSKL